MKRIGIIFGAMLCMNIAYGDTMNINWIVDGTTYDTTTCTVGGDVNLPTAPTKYGYTFRGWVNYTPIEYLESTGTQYIDTGFQPNQDTRITVVYSVSDRITSAFGIASARAGWQDRQFGIENSNNHYRASYGNIIIQDGNFAYDTKITADQNKNVATWTDQSGNELYRITHNSATFSVPYNLHLFSLNDKGTPYIMNSLKVYSFKLYDNGTLILDMIPVKDMNNVPCMFDKVSGQFFYNAGTGTFTAGPEISE